MPRSYLPDGYQPTGLESHIAIAYGCRNHGAHSVEAIEIVRKRFLDVRSAAIDIIFVTVERLYK